MAKETLTHTAHHREIAELRAQLCHSNDDIIRLEAQLAEMKAEKVEEQEEFRRIVNDDRAKDEIHCGCCVELRMRVKVLELAALEGRKT